MTNLTFKVVSDIDEAKSLWEQFSPHLTIDDEWDFRYIWGKFLDIPLHFIVGYDDDKPIGLLPLQLNKNVGLDQKLLKGTEPFLEFFGGVDGDNNEPFILPEYQGYAEAFYQQITQPAILTSLKNPVSVNGVEAIYYLDKYVLDLSDIHSFEEYATKYFSGKSKKRLRERARKFEKEYTITTREGTDEDLELFFSLNIKRFGENSSLNMEYRRRIFTEMRNLFDVDIFSILVDGIPRAAGYGIKFKGTYVSLNNGYDQSIRDISKLLFITRLNRSLARGETFFDSGQGNNGWKDFFHLTKIPQYKLILNMPTSESE